MRGDMADVVARGGIGAEDLLARLSAASDQGVRKAMQSIEILVVRRNYERRNASVDLQMSIPHDLAPLGELSVDVVCELFGGVGDRIETKCSQALFYIR